MFGRDYRKTPRKCNVGRSAREMGLVNRRVAVAQDQVVDTPPERGDELLLGNIQWRSQSNDRRVLHRFGRRSRH